MKRLIWLVCGATVLGLSYWPGRWSWLMWFGVVPFWMATRGLRPLQALGVGWAFGIVFGVVVSPSLIGVVSRFIPMAWVSTGVYAVLIIIYTSPFALAAGVNTILERTAEAPLKVSPTLSFLIAAVATMMVVVGLMPQMVPISFAAGLADQPFSVQSAALLGSAGLCLLVLIVNALVYTAVQSGAKRVRVVCIAGALGLIAANEIYGFWVLHRLDGSLQAMRVHAKKAAVIQGSVPHEIRGKPEFFAENLEVHRNLVKEAVEQGAELVVFPQNSYERWLYFAKNDAGFERPLDRLGRDLTKTIASDLSLGIEAVIGTGAKKTVRRDANKHVLRRHYASVLIGPHGEYRDFAAKRFPTPFGEYIPGGKLTSWLYPFAPHLIRIRSGPQAPLVLADGTQIGAYICRDSLIRPAARDLARAGATLLAEVSSNAYWFEGTMFPAYHLRAGLLRAVENRRYLLRAVSSGVSVIADPGGRILKTIDWGKRGMIVADVVPMNTTTGAMVLGDFFYWLSLAVIVLLSVGRLTLSRGGVKLRKENH
ncbi:MAG: apolipoprotein N-acyltransferase [Elusimicrobia bacterium]|nr:MAG: apolipoprotein N-acyltransferase [Elusimicrobiota bacterium]